MKKRRNSGISLAIDRPQIQKSSRRGGFDPFSIPRNKISSRVPHQTSDMTGVKRVRFQNLDTGREVNCQPDDSSSPAENTNPKSPDSPKTSEYQYYKQLRQAASCKVRFHLPDKCDNHSKNIEAGNHGRSDRFKTTVSEDSGHIFPSCRADKQDNNLKKTEAIDDPKTSEYQYFKKLRKDAFHGVHSYPLHKQDNHLKKIGPSHCSGELCNLMRQEYKANKSFSPVEKTTPIELKSSSLAPGASRNSEFQYGQGEIFSRKRDKLMKFAAEVSSHDVDKFSSNGSSLLLEFLQRLGIESNASSNGGRLRSRLMELGTSSIMLAYPESSMQVGKVPHATETFLMPSTAGHITQESLPECWFSESDELICSPWDRLNSHFYSTQHVNQTRPLYRSSHSESVLNGGRTTGLDFGKNSSYGMDPTTEFSFNRSGCFLLEQVPSELDCLDPPVLPPPGNYFLKQALALNNIPSFKELDEIYGPQKPALTKERCPLQLLGWEDSGLVNEPELFTESQRKAMNLNPAVTNCWSSNSSLFTIESCSPSLFCEQHSPDYTSQKLLLEWGPSSTVGSCSLEVGALPVEESDDFSLISSDTHNYLALTEGYRLSDHYKEINCSTYVNEASREKLQPSLGTFELPSSLNFGFEWKSLSPLNFFSECSPLTRPDLQFREMNIEDMMMHTGNEFNRCRAHSSDDDVLRICSINPSSCELYPSEKKVLPLLLDRSIWYDYEGDII